MLFNLQQLAVAAAAIDAASASVLPRWWDKKHEHTLIEPPSSAEYYISYGPRPYFIIQNMTASPLKTKLESCQNGPFEVSAWSIGHRGGADLFIPEETSQSQEAGARMGAGILECDVTFTSDRGLVCRHDQCDLHRTTDILIRPSLAKKCTVPFKAANGTTPASATCCTSDITIAEYKTLCSRMDGANTSAVTPADYISGGIPSWRTQLYNTCGQVLTLESYIDLVNSFPGYRNFTPELKTPPAPVPMPFKGYTQEQYARDMLDMFIKKGINPNRVFAQSFNPPDIFQWLKEYPAFGKQAVYLDEDGDIPANYTAAVARLPSLKAKGVNIIAPPMNYLLTTYDNKTIVPAPYAIAAKAAGLRIITWTFERSGPPAQVESAGEYYYNSIAPAVHTDGQLFEILDILATKCGVEGIFSDWSATTGYYANCMGLRGPYGEQYK